VVDRELTAFSVVRSRWSTFQSSTKRGWGWSRGRWRLRWDSYSFVIFQRWADVGFDGACGGVGANLHAIVGDFAGKASV